MSMRLTLTALMLPWLALHALPAWSQAEQRFRVELVIFAHEPGARGASEDFLAEPELPPQLRLEEVDLAFTQRPDWLALLATPPDAGALEDTPDTVALPPYRQLLDPAASELSPLMRRLNSQSAYRPLMHLVWDQVASVDAEPPVIDVGASVLASPQVRGTATLSRSRFLHLRLDLEYLPEAAPAPLPLTPGGRLEDTRVLVPRYRLQESRRMRSGELHYFDHPAFGVIAVVTPVSPSRAAP